MKSQIAIIFADAMYKAAKEFLLSVGKIDAGDISFVDRLFGTEKNNDNLGHNQNGKRRSPAIIDKLDDELKSQVQLMLASSKYTYSDIVIMLKSNGIKISDSSVCRYSKKMRQSDKAKNRPF